MLDVKKWISKVTASLNKPLYHTEDVSLVNGSSSTYYKSFTISVPSVSGYKPIAVRKLSLNQVNKNIYQTELTDSELIVGISNISLSGSIGSMYIYATIVYIKENVGGVARKLLKALQSPSYRKAVAVC